MPGAPAPGIAYIICEANNVSLALFICTGPHGPVQTLCRILADIGASGPYIFSYKWAAPIYNVSYVRACGPYITGL